MTLLHKIRSGNFFDPKEEEQVLRFTLALPITVGIFNLKRKELREMKGPDTNE